MMNRSPLPLAAVITALALLCQTGCASLGGAAAGPLAAKLGATGIQAAGWNPFAPKPAAFDPAKMQAEAEIGACQRHLKNAAYVQEHGCGDVIDLKTGAPLQNQALTQ